MKTKVRDLFDSFGKGPTKKTSPLSSKSIEIISSSPISEIISNSFLVDPKVGENLIDPNNKGEDIIDMELFEHSRLSGSSTSTSTSTFDSNENEILSDEEKQAKKVFNIAKEMMTSEREYVENLKLINVDFREFIDEHNSSEEIIPEKEFSDLFSNLKELQILNSDFLKDFQQRIDNWGSEKKIADIIVQKGAFLMLYTTYVQNFQNTSTNYIESCSR